jgi:tetratricopeptide (TPR) repeat protein
MSPEQAEMTALGADTRSDIFSLGVLLYELLTGTTPLSRKRVKEAAYAEILRMIKEDEPPRPSTRLSDSGEALASISAQRHMEPAKLTKLMRGELDWIVMKTLEKDRSRRYETANALAKDVQRYLKDEPVRACPPSAWYRFGKFARRNKRILATVGLLALALVAGTVVSAWQAIRATDAFNQAKTSYDLAEGRAEQIRQDLERLQAANTLLDRGRWYATERRWDDADAAFTKAVQLRPDHVSVWFERSNLYTRLGLWDLAAADYAREIELREPDTTEHWYHHALLRYAVGDLDGYRPACRSMRERFSGTVNSVIARDLVRTCALAPDADADFTPLAELAQSIQASNPGFWYELYLLGVAQYRAGQYEQAVRRLRESLAAHPDWAGRALSYPILAMAHHRLGQAAEARQALDAASKALDRWTRERYEAHNWEHWSFHQGAVAFWPISWWDWLECQLYYREAKVLIDGSPPPDDPRLHVLRARAFAGLRWSGKAGAEYDAALKLSSQDPEVRLEAHRNRGYWYTGHGQWREAAAEFAKASELHPDDWHSWRFQAVAHFAAGDVEAYQQTCTAMLERFEKTEDGTAACNVLMGCVLRDDTLPDMARLLPLTRVADPKWPWGTSVRGAALYRAGRYEESVRCFETVAKTSRPRAWDWCFLAMAHHRLGHADEARRCLAEAARWIDEANRHEGDDLSATRAAWGGWHEPVVFSLLLREAEALLAEKETKN